MRYYYIFFKMIEIKVDNNKSCLEYGKIVIVIYCW